jgi:multiple sugar transport system substrate-binding protein
LHNLLVKNRLRPLWCKYITPHSRFSPAWLALAWLALFVTACQGFDPADLTPQPQLSPTSQFTPVVLGRSTPIPTPAVEPSPTAAPRPEVSRLAGTVVRLWRTGASPTEASVRGDPFPTWLAEFNRSNAWGIRVELETFLSSEELFERLAEAGSDASPGVIVAQPYQAAGLQASPSSLVGLNEYAYDPVWGWTEEEREDFFVPTLTSEEESYWLPFYYSAYFLYYNRTLAEEIGYRSPPEDPRSFRLQSCSAASVLRTTGPTRAGGWAINTAPPTVLGWLSAFGSTIEAENSPDFAFSSPESVEAFTFLRGMYDDNCAWRPEAPLPYEVFAGRQALFATGSLDGIAIQEAVMQGTGSQDEWMILPFLSKDGPPVVPVYGPALMMTESSPEGQLSSWVLIRWLLSSENQAALVEISGVLPVRLSAGALLTGYRQEHPKWGEAFDLLPFAQPEPALPSWEWVRWPLSDSADFLFSPFLKPEEIPALLDELDSTASEWAGRP